MAAASVMYPQEIAANHVLDDFIIDPRLDAHSDLDVPTHSLLHIHCQQGAERFNKAYFSIHRYEFLDLSSLNGTIARDCATLLAVGSYRLTFDQTMASNPNNPAAAQDKKGVAASIKGNDNGAVSSSSLGWKQRQEGEL
jgi:hypothetical protein